MNTDIDNIVRAQLLSAKLIIDECRKACDKVAVQCHKNMMAQKPGSKAALRFADNENGAIACSLMIGGMISVLEDRIK